MHGDGQVQGFTLTIFKLNNFNKAEKVLLSNTVEDLVGEPTWPGRHVFQTLVSQELLELSGPIFNNIYGSNSKLRVTKTMKHSAGAFSHENRFVKVYQRVGFVL